MYQSQLFTKIKKEAPKDEVAKNAVLLSRAGFIHKELAGVYSYLPLGLRVLRKIKNIIREEMNKIGGQELLLTTLQDPESWKKSGRWDDEVVDIWFKTEVAGGAEIGLANTHEEPLTNIMLRHIFSYKDLPIYAYQIQNKFRNELRAKNGLLRGREFLMKDLYSFNANREDLNDFYEQCANAYMNIFHRVGIGDLVYRTFADGGSFSKFSDEFQMIADSGEDTIYADKEQKIAVNKEVFTDDVLSDLGLDKKNLHELKAIEVGNIFKLGTKYSEALGLAYKDDKGATHPVVMGSYGIGLGRLMAAVVEVYNDSNGIIWPTPIAPFQIHLISLSGDDLLKNESERVYNEIAKNNVEILYDDRDMQAGEKFAESDLIGIPWRVVISERTRDENKLEVKRRGEQKPSLMKLEEFLNSLK